MALNRGLEGLNRTGRPAGKARHGSDLRPAIGTDRPGGEDIKAIAALPAHPKGPSGGACPQAGQARPGCFGAAARRDKARARCKPPQQYKTTSTHINPSHQAWARMAKKIKAATPTKPMEAAIIRLRA